MLDSGGEKIDEALRVMAEISQSFNSGIHEKLENLRYSSYTLEKDIAVFSDTTEKFKKTQLYVIITSNKLQEIVELANLCAAGGADCIQLRVKDIEDGDFFDFACEFVKICRRHNVISIINDRADIAIASEADGVHLGQNDLPVENVRQLQVKPLIIGKTTHSQQELRACIDKMPTYVSIGPVFATPLKPDLISRWFRICH